MSRAHDLRAETTDPHRTVDDSPFGGGAGMVLMAEPVFAAVEAVDPPRPLYLMGPGGRTLDQAFARELADGPGFSLLCGRYEGVDARVVDHLCDGEISIGDYVLAGGEVAALVVIEAVGRLVPGVMGNTTSGDDESFSDGLLEYPHYTRPGHVPRLGRARRAPLRRPRPHRPLAHGQGAGPHGPRPPRPHRGARRPERSRPEAADRVRPDLIRVEPGAVRLLRPRPAGGPRAGRRPRGRAGPRRR